MSGRVAALLFFDRDSHAANALAAALGVEALAIARHRFPDGELRLTLPPRLAGRVIVYATLDEPNEKLVELLLLARGAREAGAASLGLVAPYLCYMRQDTAFAEGEVVSQRIVGRFLADLFDEVYTVDPHLHRVATLAQAVPARRAVALFAAQLIGEHLAALGSRPLLIGPDEESAPWVAAAAERAGLEYGVCTKRRLGDREVEIQLPALRIAGQQVVLVDDIASTGRTLAQAARALFAAGAARVDAAVTHALFVGDALETLRAAGVGDVWSTDSVRHPSNRVALAPLLAAALAQP